MSEFNATRRALLGGGITSLAALAGVQAQAAAPAAAAPGKVYKVGVISSRIRGKPQPKNGHTWHFCNTLCKEVNMDAIRKHLDPGSARLFETYMRNPKYTWNGILPYRDIQVTQYYEQDPELAKLYCETFPGVEVCTSLEKMAQEVDAIWLGDASGYGEDHFDLIAPGLARGLPTFCDKPIGASVAGTRKILDFAKANKAPIMSSSLYRHQWGTEEALRMRDSGEHGKLEYVICSQGGGYSDEGWLIYGQHPAWMVVTLCGAGVDAVSLYAQDAAAHSLVTYKDRRPAEIWYGRPDVTDTYCETDVMFQKTHFRYTPAIEGHYWFGHFYQMFNLAHAFRSMVLTGVEPVPPQEILEVTAMIHAGVKSRQEKSRLVELAEVMG